MIRHVRTDDAPPPAGHYSQATVHGGVVYVAAQLPLDPKTREIVSQDAKEQTLQVLDNIEAILDSAGSSLGNLLKVTIYVSDITLWATVNEAYAERLGPHQPARSVVAAKELKAGAHVIMDAIAAC